MWGCGEVHGRVPPILGIMYESTMFDDHEIVASVRSS